MDPVPWSQRFSPHHLVLSTCENAGHRVGDDAMSRLPLAVRAATFLVPVEKTCWASSFVLLILFGLGAARPAPTAAQEVSRTGRLHVIWGDPPSGQPQVRYQLIDELGRSVEILIDEGLARYWPDGDEFWCN